MKVYGLRLLHLKTFPNDLIHESDMFTFGYLIPNLKPIEEQGFSDWGKPGKKVRGVVTSLHDGYGFMRFMDQDFEWQFCYFANRDLPKKFQAKTEQMFTFEVTKKHKRFSGPKHDLAWTRKPIRMKSSTRFQYYFKKHFSFGQLLGGDEEETGKAPAFNRYKASPLKHALVTALRISPWICGLVLLVVLGLEIGLSEAEKAHYTSLIDILKTVSVGGLIGFGTNFLAIRMLFRPLKKRPLLGQGMIPAQRDIIIGSLAKGMHTHILSQRLIRQRLEESGFVKRINDVFFYGTIGMIRDKELISETKTALNKTLTTYFEKEEVKTELKTIIDQQVEQKADKGLKRLVLNTYKRLNREDYDALLDQIISDIPDSIHDIIERWEGELEEGIVWLKDNRRAADLFLMRLITNVLNKLDIEALLARQMAHFDEERLERMVWDATNEQLLYIQYLGTILGMLGGLVIWNAWMLVIYAGVGLSVWGLDELLMKVQKSGTSASTSSSTSASASTSTSAAFSKDEMPLVEEEEVRTRD